jgi:hypothetical protein
MPAPDYEPLSPPSPPLTADAGPIVLTPEQEKLYQQVLEHFNKPDYALPDEEKTELSEEEKFWLVCTVSTVQLPSILITSSLMSVCCGDFAC